MENNDGQINSLCLHSIISLLQHFLMLTQKHLIYTAMIFLVLCDFVIQRHEDLTS